MSGAVYTWAEEENGLLAARRQLVEPLRTALDSISFVQWSADS